MIAKVPEARTQQSHLSNAFAANAVCCAHCGEVLLRGRLLMGGPSRNASSTRIVCVSCNHAMMVRL